IGKKDTAEALRLYRKAAEQGLSMAQTVWASYSRPDTVAPPTRKLLSPSSTRPPNRASPPPSSTSPPATKKAPAPKLTPSKHSNGTAKPPPRATKRQNSPLLASRSPPHERHSVVSS